MYCWSKTNPNVNKKLIKNYRVKDLILTNNNEQEIWLSNLKYLDFSREQTQAKGQNTSEYKMIRSKKTFYL